MIEFTEQQIVTAATALKVIRLVNAGLDTVAVKLNCGPTFDEIETMRRCALALGYATFMRPFDVAAELEKRR